MVIEISHWYILISVTGPVWPIASQNWGAWRVGFRATALLRLLKLTGHSRQSIVQYKHVCSQHWSRSNRKTRVFDSVIMLTVVYAKLNSILLVTNLVLMYINVNFMIIDTHESNAKMAGFRIRINNKPLQHVLVAKYFGIFIEANPKWDKDIKIMASKVSSKIGILRYIRKLVPIDTLMQVFHGVIIRSSGRVAHIIWRARIHACAIVRYNGGVAHKICSGRVHACVIVTYVGGIAHIIRRGHV